jgi:hypothetical protein
MHHHHHHAIDKRSFALGMMSMLAVVSVFQNVLVSTSVFGNKDVLTWTLPTKSSETAAVQKSAATTRLFSTYTSIPIQPPSQYGIAGQSCRYEGHCGIGTTCWQGTCHSYHQDATRTTEYAACFLSCREELQFYEYRHFHSQPIIQEYKKPTTTGGCWIRYLRKRTEQRWNNFSDQVYAEATKYHRIVRIDPNLINPGEWIAYCRPPCSTKNTASACPQGLECRDGVVCQPPPPPSLHKSHHDMVIVTATDDRYFTGLSNLVGSLQHWAPHHKLVVYNLGLSEDHMIQISQWRNVLSVKWKLGIPSHYPDHVRLQPRVYAWKPLILNESLHEFGQIFWLDAGSTVTNNITEIIRITQQSGICLVKGQDEDMKPWSHPATYAYFGYEKETFPGGGHYSGNTQAYLYPSRYVDTIVIPNAKCALNPNCIYPEGSSLSNHRFDQTTLSILAYRWDLQIPEYTQYLAAGREQLHKDLNQPSEKIVWTSRLSCNFFQPNEK